MQMEYIDFKNVSFTINSKRLTIRRFNPSDLEEFAGFMTDPESTKFLTFSDSQKSRKGASELLEATINSYDSDSPMMAFAVEASDSREFVGLCGLTPHESDTVEIMYATVPRARGNGYAVEIARALAMFATSQLGYSRVIAPISPENKTSKTVAIKAGFQQHGLHQHQDGAEKVQLFIYKKNDT